MTSWTHHLFSRGFRRIFQAGHTGAVQSFCGLLLLHLASCAITNATISPPREYPYSDRAPPNNISVSLGKITHKGYIRSRVGVKKNGYGMEMAGVFYDQHPAKILRKIFIAELQEAGFQVLEEDAGIYPEIEIKILQYFIEPEVGLFAGDVYGILDARVTVHISEEVSFRRRFTGIGKSRTLIWLMVFYEKAMERATRSFMRKSIPEIRKLILEQKGQGK